MPNQNKLPETLSKNKTLIFEKLGMNLENVIENKESAEYSACSFEINSKKVIFRKAKITPTKVGQFVTI